MSYQVGKIATTKKSKPSYVYSIISVTLVLFMIGILGCFLVYGNTVVRYLRENIEVTLILKNSAKEVDILQLQKRLDKEKYVKSTQYISKDEAAKIMQKDFGEDMKLLDYNPLYASIVLHLNAAYANQDSISVIEKQFASNPNVEEVYYMKGIVDVVNKNVRNIVILFGAIALIFFLVALALIDNTIKLTMYSNRFLIRSMQLVGATRWFIIKPFIGRSIANGLVAGLTSVIALIGLLYYAQDKLPANLIVSSDMVTFSIIFVCVILIGISLSLASTYFAVSKYLKIKLDDLY
jgi:cell division transport system permease protein